MCTNSTLQNALNTAGVHPFYIVMGSMALFYLSGFTLLDEIKNVF
jgi:hypothetical protein